jgi:hypothetical protein
MGTEPRIELHLEGCHQCGLPAVTLRHAVDPAHDRQRDATASFTVVTGEAEEPTDRFEEFPVAESF